MKNVVVTGSAKRGGNAIARHLHARGCRVILHCRDSSLQAATALRDELNALRSDSAIVWSADFTQGGVAAPAWSDDVFGIVASASEYVADESSLLSERIERDMNTHLYGHLALINQCRDSLVRQQGAIVAITDIHVERPMRGYTSYLAAKGALAVVVRSLAVELAPHVRVNAVAPGALDWPVGTPYAESRKTKILEATPLGRTGTFDELAGAVAFLLLDATFCTGTTLAVDGGRSIYLE